MEKTYYEVRVFTVETRQGEDAYGKWINSTNQTTHLIGRYDTLERAQECYKEIGASCTYNPYHRIYVHECRCIEVNTYEVDEDGDEEWASGGDWYDYDIPERPTDSNDDEDDDDEE